MVLHEMQGHFYLQLCYKLYNVEGSLRSDFLIYLGI